MDNKLVSLIITLAVGVIMVGALLAPIVSDYSDATKIHTNEGTPYAAIDSSMHTLVISMDSDGELSITLDGDAVEMPDFSYYSAATIIYGSDGLVRLGSNGLVQCFGNNQGSLYVHEDTPVTVTFNTTGVSMTDGDSSKASAFTVLAHIGEGDYSLSKNPCVTDESVIIAGVTRITSNDKIVFLANGTLDNLTVSTGYVESTDSLTVSSVTAESNTNVVSGDLIKINSVVFTAVMSDSSEWVGTYDYFLAPAEVEYNNGHYLGTGNAAILVATVVVVIASLVAAAAMAANRENDL